MRLGMRRIVAKIWPIILFLGIWEAGTHVFGVPAYILPAPDRVLTRIVGSGGVLSVHTWISVIEIMAGFIAAAFGGFLLGVAIVYSRRIEQAVEPFLVVSQVIPKVALAPLFIIWFGHGLQPKIIIAATIAFFPILVNTVLGLKAADPEIIELMNSIAASKRQIFWRVRLPNSLPYILPSLKVAALLSVVGAMVGEFVGSDKGLGYLMILGDVNLDTDLLFAALVVVTLVGLVIYGAVGLVEQRVARRYGTGDGQLIVAA
jgi:NitT/TauT family transport system permease protein